MTTDLTSTFQNAQDTNSWRSGKFRLALASLQNCLPETQIEWEEGDENWARLLHQGNVIALVNVLIPVAFVLSRHSSAVCFALRDCNTILVDSFSEAIFRIDKDVLEKILGKPLSSNVNYDRLSIDDLWWATV
jgi:hypothetical protein